MLAHLVPWGSYDRPLLLLIELLVQILLLQLQLFLVVVSFNLFFHDTCSCCTCHCHQVVPAGGPAEALGGLLDGLHPLLALGLALGLELTLHSRIYECFPTNHFNFNLNCPHHVPLVLVYGQRHLEPLPPLLPLQDSDLGVAKLDHRVGLVRPANLKKVK